MGGDCTKTKPTGEVDPPISKVNFDLRYAIGRGGFGKVWRVESKKDKEHFAMKEMAKARIIHKKSVQSVNTELLLLTLVESTFIVNVQYAFQDKLNLYLVMDLLLGGDLRFHLQRQRKFSEEVTKFIIACLVHALDAVHAANIIHRDIKPENLVFDNEGYLRLTDFGVARIATAENASETSGTPGYMAPEVMCRKNHGLVSDVFAVGVIAYECMQGRRPYVGRTRREIRDQIVCRQVQIKRFEIIDGWSIEAADFINKCLLRSPNQRIGCKKGIEDLKEHPWFVTFDWSLLASRRLQSPFMPDISRDNFDLNHVNSLEWKDAEQVKEIENLQLKRDSVQQLFEVYYYDRNDIKQAPHITARMSMQMTTKAYTGMDTTQQQNEDGSDKTDSD